MSRPPATPDEALDLVAGLLRDVPDFPSPGIRFWDLTTLLADAAGFTAVVDLLAALQRSVAAARSARGESPDDAAEPDRADESEGEAAEHDEAPAKKTTSRTDPNRTGLTLGSNPKLW